MYFFLFFAFIFCSVLLSSFGVSVVMKLRARSPGRAAGGIDDFIDFYPRLFSRDR